MEELGSALVSEYSMSAPAFSAPAPAPVAQILVIDDDPVFRKILVSLLRDEFQVTTAANGIEGFQIADNTPPDLALIDVQMPRWDGLQTLRAFRSHAELKDLPILMLTGDASRATVTAAIEGGATDYIIKTAIHKDELLHKVHGALRRSLQGHEGDSLNDDVSPAQLQSVLDSWE